MALESHGLKWLARDLDSIALSADGSHVTLSGDRASGVGTADQAAFAAFAARNRKFTRLLAKLFAERPPKLVEANLLDRLSLFKLGLGLKMLGKDDMSEFMRIVLMNMYDLMQETFDSPRLQALLSMDAVLGARTGPRTPGTVFAYLYRQLSGESGFGGAGLVSGGMGSLGSAMAASAAAAGAEIRLGTRVAAIEMDADRATGVRLEDGSVIAAAAVVSNADPVTTFRDLVGYQRIEAGTARRITEIRHGSGTAKLHLALDGLPSLAGLSRQQLGQRLVIAPDMDYLERAFNAVKYDDYSAEPVMDISIPSLHDPGLAPDGRHVLSAIVQYAPYAPAGGWKQHREAFLERLLGLLGSYAPGIRQQVVASELLTPQDLERRFGMVGGHWHHGEMSLDQVLMNRPFPGSSQYGTPVRGLYLCGAGTHPGGGLMGLAGRNAAREILRRGEAA
jgi:phytoene dehydrogenase-like protein